MTERTKDILINIGLFAMLGGSIFLIFLAWHMAEMVVKHQ